MVMTVDTLPAYEIQITDVELQQRAGEAQMGTLYRPVGAGPFAALLEVHGGAWTSKDRFNNAETAKQLAKDGIVVLSIEFRMPPEGPYPISLQDINFGVRWLKFHARDYGSSPERVGIYGTSSGGNSVLLSAMRPTDARYRAVPFKEAPDLDAKVAFVVTGWGVIDPVARYGLAKASNTQGLIKAHHAYWGTELVMSDGSPPRILERGERVELPPYFLYQGTADKWTPVAVAEHFVDLYRKAGGKVETAFFEGEPHAFVNDKPDAANTKKAIAMMAAFIRQFGGAAQSAAAAQ